MFVDTSAKDLNGNSLNAYQASFRTTADPDATAPAVTATNPVSGTSGVPLNPVITLTYNVPLDPATVDSTSVTVSGPTGTVTAAVSVDATGRVIRIVPGAALAPEAFYSYQTTTAIRGANGLSQRFTASWFFSTGTASDTTAPTVARTVTPPNGAINVGDNAAVLVRFSEPINPATVTGATIAISAGGNAIAASVSSRTATATSISRRSRPCPTDRS